MAHLGNGASFCAMLGGRSVATTMGFTPADGLMIGTRAGSLDPGVLLNLTTRYGMGAAELEHLVYHESGLLGVSGVSSDMRTLLASGDPHAAETVDLLGPLNERGADDREPHPAGAEPERSQQMSTTPTIPAGSLVPLSDEKAALEILTKSLLGLWETVNTLTRLRPTKRDRYRVTIFGSARIDQGHWVYGAVRDVSAELTRLGCDVVTGGGPGLMQAANEGAKLADPDGTRQSSVGIRVELPFEQDVNAFVTQAFEHKTFFTRLHHFVLVSDAFIVTPGGIGTVLETLMVWQLLQVRHLRDTPLILAGHFWDGLLDWAKAAMLRSDAPLVSPEDLTIPQVLADGPSIVRAIRDHHALWKARQDGPTDTTHPESPR